MTSSELLGNLTHRGIVLSIVGGKIHYKPTPDPATLAEMRQHKAGLLSLLGRRDEGTRRVDPPQHQPAPETGPLDRLKKVETGDTPELAEERAAILEYDGGLSRVEAERRAGLRPPATILSGFVGEPSSLAGVSPEFQTRENTGCMMTGNFPISSPAFSPQEGGTEPRTIPDIPRARARAADTPAMPHPCLWCDGHRFWVSPFGPIRCASCHPPAKPSIAVRWIETDLPRPAFIRISRISPESSR